MNRSYRFQQALLRPGKSPAIQLSAWEPHLLIVYIYHDIPMFQPWSWDYSRYSHDFSWESPHCSWLDPDSKIAIKSYWFPWTTGWLSITNNNRWMWCSKTPKLHMSPLSQSPELWKSKNPMKITSQLYMCFHGLYMDCTWIMLLPIHISFTHISCWYHWSPWLNHQKNHHSSC